MAYQWAITTGGCGCRLALALGFLVFALPFCANVHFSVDGSTGIHSGGGARLNGLAIVAKSALFLIEEVGNYSTNADGQYQKNNAYNDEDIHVVFGRGVCATCHSVKSCGNTHAAHARVHANLVEYAKKKKAVRKTVSSGRAWRPRAWAAHGPRHTELSASASRNPQAEMDDLC